MIKANELRIGNILNNNGKICELIGMTWQGGDQDLSSNHDLVFSNGDYEVSLRHVSEIPLTEEILLKVGFEVKPFSLGLTLDRFRFIWKEKYKYWYVVDAYSQSYLTKIEFVHELQNFVFVMNSQELNTAGLI